MTEAFAAHSNILLRGRELALELRTLLREMDREALRDDLTARARARLLSLQERLRDLIDALPEDGAYHELRRRLSDMVELLRAHMPRPNLPRPQLRAAWSGYRAQLQDAYERLSRSFEDRSIRLPRLRPNNYMRSVVHCTMALSALLMVELVLRGAGVLIAGLSVAALAWTLETLRRVSPRANTAILKVLGPIAHPHERNGMRVNSATWYSTALLVIALLFQPPAIAMALAVLGFADPTAGLVGRRLGRIRLAGDRTVEGSLAFLGAGLLASLAVLLIWHGAFPVGTALLAAFTASLFGALAELFSGRLDDNFSIPIAAAAGAQLILSLLG